MKKKILIASVCAALVLTLAVGVYWFFHPTHYKYNDRFIIGSTEAEIVEKYGAFSKSTRNDAGEITCGVYMIRDNTPEQIMGYDDSVWYEVYFEDGIATRVRLQEGWYGG